MHLFLDFDGILNSTAFYIERKSKTQMFCTKRIGWLNALCRALPDLNIVISSTWRKNHTLEENNAMLAEYGAEFRAVGQTPVIHPGCRGDEVKAYCNQHGITNYAIVDDDSDFLPEQLPRCVFVDGYWGLSPNTCYRIKNILSKG